MPNTAASGTVHVAAGLLLQDGRVFITRRPTNTHQGGKWEFPGGKLLSGETALAALKRELHEELGVEVEEAVPYMQVRHRYLDKEVLLDVWRVTAYRGAPHGREGQGARWAAPSDLVALEFPAADLPVLRRLWLPPLYLISDAARIGKQKFFALLESALNAGARLIHLREPQMDESEFRAYASEVIALCRRHGARILLNASPELAVALGADGVHLKSARLMRLTERPLGNEFWVAASCHDADELKRAADVGADFAMLGPVAHTASHPGVVPLGWEKFENLCRGAALPVYALGGMRAVDLPRARAAGAQGVAMIRGVWDAVDPADVVKKINRQD